MWASGGRRGREGGLPRAARGLLLLSLTILSADGLRCFFKLEADNIQTVIDCDRDSTTNNSKACITVLYPSGRYAIGCEVTDKKLQEAGEQVNCTLASSGILNISNEIRNFTCCENTVCNQLSSITVQNSFNPGTEVVVRCTDFTEVDHLTEGTKFKDRKCTPNAFSSILTGPSTCSAVELKANSEWAVGQRSDFQNTFYNQDTSPPACYEVSGFVQGGFCGPRRETAKFGDAELGKAFDGKYQMKLCAGSKTEALSVGNGLSVGAQDLTYANCLDLLTTSSLDNDCSAIRGQFNVTKQFASRRAILPDCCVDYYHTPSDVRAACTCGGGDVVDECVAVCCCDTALNEKNADDRCQILRDFMWIDYWLEKMVREECCNTRLLDQCKNNRGCRDTDGEQGMVKGISALPMCCSYCLSFFDKMCSYVQNLDGGSLVISMRSQANIPILESFCRDVKNCKDDYPCNFLSDSPRLAVSFGAVAVASLAALTATMRTR